MKNSNPLKKIAKIGVNQIQDLAVLLGRGLNLIDFPVPPNSSMRKTSSRSIRHYYVSGIRSCLPIAVAALREGVALEKNINVLDFGCGVGRQLLHFTRDYPNPTYHACDIDDSSIAFIARNYPSVQARVNRFTPPLDYGTGFFDLVYSVSIFSHLNLEDQAAWLSELGRVVKPGGYCMLTTEGYTALRSLAGNFGRNPLELDTELAQKGYLFKEYDGWQEEVKNQNVMKLASQMVGVERSYGNTVLSPAFIGRNWNNDLFEVVSILEGVIDTRQDLVVLRRRVS
ncbi:MAG: class I SAM-dependent methyltransferase [Burkholderiales bacterium]